MSELKGTKTMSIVSHLSSPSTIGSVTMPTQDYGPLLRAVREQGDQIAAAIAKISMTVNVPEIKPTIAVKLPENVAPIIKVEAKLPEQAVASITVNIPAWPFIAASAIPTIVLIWDAAQRLWP